MSDDKYKITNYAQASDDSELAKMEELLARDPESVPLLEWIAFMYYTSESTDRAIELYTKLVTLDSENEAHHYYLANLHQKNSNFPKAVNHWKEVLRINPASKFSEKSERLIEEHS